MPSALQLSNTNWAWTDVGYCQFMGWCWGKGTADKSLTSLPSYPTRDMLNQSRNDAARRLWSQMAKDFLLPQYPRRSRLEAMGRICLLRAKNNSNWIGKRPIYDYESNQGHLNKAEL